MGWNDFPFKGEEEPKVDTDISAVVSAVYSTQKNLEQNPTLRQINRYTAKKLGPSIKYFLEDFDKACEANYLNVDSGVYSLTSEGEKLVSFESREETEPSKQISQISEMNRKARLTKRIVRG
jgi:hypothetical protein